MYEFLVKRVIQYVLVLFIMITLNFFLPRMMPGNPLVFLAGEDVGFMSQAEKVEIMTKYGLDKPMAEQYLIYLKNLAMGDLGYSYQQKMPIVEIITSRLPWTLLLTGSSVILSTLIGMIVGVLSAWKRGSRMDISLLAGGMFLHAMPSFWVGMILVSIFAAHLNWFPVYGAETVWASYSGWERMVDIVKHLALPLATLVLISVSSVYLTMRNSMLHILWEDYILMARVMGVKDRTIKYKHAMRNALLPVFTVFMINLGFMFGGATVIETVFAYPGIGRLMFEAVMSRDYPVIQASFLMITFTVIAANVITDMVYPFLDPRVGRSHG